MKGYPTGFAWDRSHAHEQKMNENCAVCGDRHLKRNMYGIFLVRPRSATPKKWCYVCERCIANVADLVGTSIGG